MKVTRTDIPDVLLLEPRVQQDARGFLLESYNRRTFEGATGLSVDFVQDNTSFSVRNVLRGLHYQIRQPQGKAGPGRGGEIFDVALGLRSTWFLRRCCPVRVRPCRRNENSIDVVEGRIF
jgi:dTDP-4-dehydrorhamnose 3,5-epimerase